MVEHLGIIPVDTERRLFRVNHGGPPEDLGFSGHRGTTTEIITEELDKERRRAISYLSSEMASRGRKTEHVIDILFESGSHVGRPVGRTIR
jgi:hypothetical protein